MTDSTDMPMRCPYCLGFAEYRPSSAELYRGTDYGPVWICQPCGAWVGCHRGGTGRVPLGRLADKALRDAKRAAHAEFDPLWMAKMRRDGLRKRHARAKAYAWLSRALSTAPEETHIGMFDIEMCRRVVQICRPYATRIRRTDTAFQSSEETP